ncbi:hypothetical protein NHX12_012241, partial [Muraenolepis orangiensis]
DLLQRSKRRWVLSTIELAEEDKGPFPKMITQMFNDRKKEDNHMFNISGMGVTEKPFDVFSIKPFTGEVYVHSSIDREKYPWFHIKFDILNKDTNKPLDLTLSFDVDIIDINDNAPTFDHKVMRASVKENVPEGLLPVRLQARDMDQENTINSTFTISILSQEPKEPKLKIDQTPETTIGQLAFEGCFNYDEVKNYKVIVKVEDHGKPPLSSTAVINLKILDSNSHLPTFKEREYSGQVKEMEINKEILRLAVDDKDTPKTPGWRAKYFFIKGNEENNYKITTDPDTNEGILTVIKGKDFERTTMNILQIGVENEESLYLCKKGGGTALPPSPDTTNISLNIIDVNDAPVFEKKVADVYQKEEDKPGETLYEILEDPAHWVSIDAKTGVTKTVAKMDRESPYVNGSVYKIVVAAIDNGQPPATATSTILVHLRDINDNIPGLVSDSVVMCADTANKVVLHATDKDLDPFSGPFSFFLLGKDKALKETWKIDPATGQQVGLVALKSLPYGNYSVPLVIQDQQGVGGGGTVVSVVVCDCDGGTACRGKRPLSKAMGSAAIGLLFAALLLLLLMLLFLCQCAGKQFQHNPITLDDGNQTLIKYNEEGGGSACKTGPTTFLRNHTSSVTATDGVKLNSEPTYQITSQEERSYQTSGHMMMDSMGSQKQPQPQQQRDTLRSQGGQMGNMSTSGKYAHASNMHSDHLIAEHLDNKLYAMLDGNVDYPLYHPIEFSYEGQGSKCQSLDQLSLDLGDNLDFLNNLDPKFKTLGVLCGQDVPGRNKQL